MEDLVMESLYQEIASLDGMLFDQQPQHYQSDLQVRTFLSASPHCDVSSPQTFFTIYTRTWLTLR